VRPDCRGAANRPSGAVVAILAMRPFVANEDHMADYRPDAPAVDLFTADEQLVLCDWFGVDPRRSERWVRDIFDEWNIPEEIYGYPRTSAASHRYCSSGSRIAFRSGWARRKVLALCLTDAHIVRSSCCSATC